MRLWLVVIPLAFLLHSFSAGNALADVRTSDEPGTPLAIVTALGSLTTVANAVLWAQDGSEPVGAVGIFLGSIQIGLGLTISNDSQNSEFKAFTITTGALGVIAGTGSMLRGRNSKNRAARGIEVTPGIDLADRSVGVQMIARW